MSESTALQSAEPSPLLPWERLHARWYAHRIALTGRTPSFKEEKEFCEKKTQRMCSRRMLNLLRRTPQWQTARMEAEEVIQADAERAARAQMKKSMPLVAQAYRQSLRVYLEELKKADDTATRLSVLRSAPPLLNPGIDRVLPRKTEHTVTNTSVNINLSVEQAAALNAPIIDVTAEEIIAEVLPDEPA